MKLSKLTTLAIIVTATLSSTAFASGNDARSVGMGGVGVASSDYLSSGFYNPALAAKYHDDDDFGMILPSITLSVHDANDLYHNIDEFQSINDTINNSTVNSMNNGGNFNKAAIDTAKNNAKADVDKWVNALNALDNSTISINANAGIAVSVPNHYASAVLFTRAVATGIVTTNVDQSDIDYINEHGNVPENNQLKSTVSALAGGYADIGLSLAHSFTLPFNGQSFAIGISPKMQKIYALKYKKSVGEFEGSEFNVGDDHTEKSAFNIDFGLTYKPMQDVTIGFAATNLIKQELKTNIDVSNGIKSSATYIIEPKYTLGTAYSNGYVTVAMDVDLNKQRYFKEIDANTQFASLGVELNAWDWAQLRAGYSHSMTAYAKDKISAGIGLKPFGAFGIDIGAQYGQDNNYTVAAQFVLTI